MSNDLKTRVITAFFFVLTMVAGIYFSVYSLWVLFGIINALCIYEYQGISTKMPGNHPRNQQSEAMFNVVMGTLIYLLITTVALGWIPSYALICLLPLLLFFFLKALFSHAESPLTRLASNLLGILWITIPCSLFVPLSLISGSFQPLMVIGAILLVWSSDTFAYFSGRAFGKTPLFKRVSPKKTWEGSIGGMLACLIIAFLLSKLVPQWTWLEWSVIAVLAAVFGTLGDLVESLLKRSVKIKDSGNILPGHGGFLDRFDALLFATPFIFTFVYIISQ